LFASSYWIFCSKVAGDRATIAARAVSASWNADELIAPERRRRRGKTHIFRISDALDLDRRLIIDLGLDLAVSSLSLNSASLSLPKLVLRTNIVLAMCTIRGKAESAHCVSTFELLALSERLIEACDLIGLDLEIGFESGILVLEMPETDL
jgi:hypothetical protein